MSNSKLWLVGAFLLGTLAATVAPGTTPSLAQRGERHEEANYWRHHDGRWSHWDARDKRWYYTDGQHWFFHNGKTWEPYRFDKTFGRDHFEKGSYVPPGPDFRGAVPRHEVYTHR